MNPTEFHSARKFATTPTAKTAYFELGSGPAALLLHAFPLCSFQWRDVMPDLAPIRRCIAPDMMGLGYSEVAAGADISFTAQAAMLARMLDALRIDRVDVVGNDSGGGISQVFAATYPHRVRTLTLTNCEVNDLWPTPMLEPIFAALAGGMAGKMMTAMASDIAIARQQLAPVYESVDWLTPEIAQTYFEPLGATKERAELLRGFGAALKNRDQMVALAPQLRESKIPAQVIWGEADTAFDTAGSLKWLRGNLGSTRRIVIVPRAKLLFPEEHPRLLSTLLREFWENN
jgi:pimeloyl-ACP methyl ester carboxylesterase